MVSFHRSSREACPAEPQLSLCRDTAKNFPVPCRSRTLTRCIHLSCRFRSLIHPLHPPWLLRGKRGCLPSLNLTLRGAQLDSTLCPSASEVIRWGRQGCGGPRLRAGLTERWCACTGVFGFRAEKKASITLEKPGGLKCRGTSCS